MPIQATNNFVFVIRDKTEAEKSGFFIPDQGREKSNTGTVLSLGDLVQDKTIKKSKNKKCIFFKGTGFHIEFEDVEYLVLTSDQIIAIL
jgi:co-chaperonin GroES (HSP10)